MTGSLNWLGHNDLCSIQWSDYCDCNPGKPVDLSVPDEVEELDEP